MLKNTYLILGIIFSYSSLTGQERVGGIIKTGDNLKDRFVIDFTIDGWEQVPEGINTRFYSPGMNFNAMHDVPFGESSFSFALGYGISSINVHHDGDFIELEDSLSGEKYTSLQPFAANYDYKKNKIVCNYVDVPFELRLRTKGERPFRLYAGAKVGYLINAHTKVRDIVGKRKNYTIPHILKYHYGLYGRIGYGPINFYGFYSLTPMLKEGRNVELTPVSVGFSFFLL